MSLAAWMVVGLVLFFSTTSVAVCMLSSRISQAEEGWEANCEACQAEAVDLPATTRPRPA